tara:strand:- start:97 stop:273 length:177 start_codon:yes stop_codon:yes gene_type:complete
MLKALSGGNAIDQKPPGSKPSRSFKLGEWRWRCDLAHAASTCPASTKWMVIKVRRIHD